MEDQTYKNKNYYININKMVPFCPGKRVPLLQLGRQMTPSTRKLN